MGTSVLAAPSLPITKPPVSGTDTGPDADPHSARGQWFSDTNTVVFDFRSHEFYDNTAEQAGGTNQHRAITGYITDIKYDSEFPIPPPKITSFSIIATISNDTPSLQTGWAGATNSHVEALSTTNQWNGTLFSVVLTAEFAWNNIRSGPTEFNYPYIFAANVDVNAVNEDLWAWYCWNPSSFPTRPGGWFVPAWNFGDIPKGMGATRVLNFSFQIPLPSEAPLYSALKTWQMNGTDVFANRSTSLKIESWLNNMEADSPADPLDYVNVTNSVSVFHNITPPISPLVETNAPGLKWSQFPDLQYGVNVESWGIGTSTQNWVSAFKVADDWLCDGRPVAGVRWWGSFKGYLSGDYHEQPSPAFQPVAFLLTWHTDVPATLEVPYSRPGSILARELYPLSDPAVSNPPPGLVAGRHYTSVILNSFMPSPYYEHVYEYTVDFPADRIWNEKEGQVYWLAIEAVYTNTPTGTPWGWETTDPLRNWNDAAVLITNSTTNALFHPPPGWPTNALYVNQPVNMAFQLISSVEGRRAKKWAQPLDPTNGTSLASYRVQNVATLLRADDFLSDGRRITDLHWWGSYLGYKTNFPGPVLPPTNMAVKPLGFDLGWWQDIPQEGATPSHPGLLLTNVFVSISNCYEVYYSTLSPGASLYDHKFQYYVDLLNVATPWLASSGTIYWVSIQAVFPGSMELGGAGSDALSGWSWALTPPDYQWNDFSVFSEDLGQTNWLYGNPAPVDLAFELTTDELGGPNAWHEPVMIKEILRNNRLSQTSLKSVGDLGTGVQIIQFCISLVTSNWVDLATNPVPLPAPRTNFWGNFTLSETSTFFRIIQK